MSSRWNGERGFVRSVFILIFIVAIGLLAFFAGRKSMAKKPEETHVRKSDIVSVVRNVLDLAVVEMRISQIYEVNTENLRVSSVPIPFTKKQSLIEATGTSRIGYDLAQADITEDAAAKIVIVRLPPAEILSLDVNFRFLFEKDTFLNRITPEDRNNIMNQARSEIRNSLMTDALRARVLGRADEVLRQLGGAMGVGIQRLEKIPPT